MYLLTASCSEHTPLLSISGSMGTTLRGRYAEFPLRYASVSRSVP